MEYNEITHYNNKVLFGVDLDLSNEYETGILNNVRAYVQNMSPAMIKIEDGKLYVLMN